MISHANLSNMPAFTGGQSRMAALRTELALLDLPVRVEKCGHTVLLHLCSTLTTAQEAHLLNVVSHRVSGFSLDPIVGPTLPPAMVRARVKEYTNEHPLHRG